MYTQQALLDLHERSHRSLRKLLAHCGELDAEALDRELQGFGYPSVRLQLHHVIGAQEYWVGVLKGKFSVEENDADYPTVATLEAYRAQVARTTDEYLRGASDAELNTPREMLTWQEKRRVLVPAHVLMRTVTHIYHHQGQVMALCRLLGKPGPAGLDFPLD
jgi:uncharacterized damage-inducible protein DinB